MQRITMSMDDNLVAALDRHMVEHRYGSRSEAMRDILRDRAARDELAARADGPDSTFCMATLTYIYDHNTRAPGQRLTEAQHAHHDLQVSTLHVHLDHHACLEVSVLRGQPKQVRELAYETLSQRGVRHGHLHLMPADLDKERHRHGGASKPPAHIPA